jgi:predicted esterase
MWPAAVLLVSVGFGLGGCPGALPEYPVDVSKDVVYGQGYVSDGTEPATYTLEPLLLDVYQPIGSPEARKPAILLVHGGSFTEGSKEKEQIVEYARFFSARGYVSFAMNYRLVADNPPAPDYWATTGFTSAIHAAMVDVKAAARFIRAAASQYGVDPDRMALLGESAGASAAVSTAMADAGDFASDGPRFPIPESNHPDVSPRVQAYVHLWGNADHVLLEVDSDDPPVMIVHGTDDDRFGARFEASERFDTVLGLRNVPHVFYEADGFGHGAWDYRRRGRGLKLLVMDFLDQYMPDKRLDAADLARLIQAIRSRV